MNAAYDSQELSRLLHDFEDNAGALRGQSTLWSTLKENFDNSRIGDNETTADTFFLLAKTATALYKPHKLLEQEKQLEITAELGDKTLDYFLNQVPKDEWANHESFSPLLKNGLVLLQEIYTHKKIYDEILYKKSILSRVLQNAIKEPTSSYGKGALNSKKMELLIEKISYLFTYTCLSGSRLILERSSSRRSKFTVSTINESIKHSASFTESRFYFLWFLCYVKIEELSNGLQRGDAIPPEIYSGLTPRLKQSLARGWNDPRNPIEAAAQQAKYKTDINKKIPGLIELVDGVYLINSKIKSQHITLPD